MRESIGGTVITGIVIFFITIFSAFLAISVNYTKAFKVKNRIINILEESEGYSDNAKTKISEYLKNAGFSMAVKNTSGSYVFSCPDEFNDKNGNKTYPEEGGYCIKKICASEGAYYKVASFIKIEIPIIWNVFTVPVIGETMVIYTTTDGCSN